MNFHCASSCLQSWLEQDTSCPTCRLGLSVEHHVNLHPNINRIDEPENGGRPNNHFFQFNGLFETIIDILRLKWVFELIFYIGSRYVSWLPNFSVEVTHINTMLRTNPLTTTHTSQIRNMARQVQQMFPHYPMSVIIGDIQLYRSMEITIDNILEGRLPIPARFQDFNDENEFGDTNRVGATGDDANGESAAGASSSSGVGGGGDYSNASSSSDSGYEIERNSNIFGNQNELLRDERLVFICLFFSFFKIL